MSDWPLFIGIPLWFWLFILPGLLAVCARIFQQQARRIFSPLWGVLDGVYMASGIVAAGFMILILLIIIGQMIARWLGFTFEGSTEFAGYAMAATSFFAMAHALGRGAHIRVSIFLNINAFTRLWLNAFAMWMAALVATYFARFALKTNYMSEMLNDRTQGQDQVPDNLLAILQMFVTSPTEWGRIWAGAEGSLVYTPIWLPQLSMSFGTILLAIALWDHLIRLLVLNESAIQSEVVR